MALEIDTVAFCRAELRQIVRFLSNALNRSDAELDLVRLKAGRLEFNLGISLQQMGMTYLTA